MFGQRQDKHTHPEVCTSMLMCVLHINPIKPLTQLLSMFHLHCCTNTCRSCLTKPLSFAVASLLYPIKPSTVLGLLFHQLSLVKLSSFFRTIFFFRIFLCFCVYLFFALKFYEHEYRQISLTAHSNHLFNLLMLDQPFVCLFLHLNRKLSSQTFF